MFLPKLDNYYPKLSAAGCVLGAIIITYIYINTTEVKYQERLAFCILAFIVGFLLAIMSIVYNYTRKLRDKIPQHDNFFIEFSYECFIASVLISVGSLFEKIYYIISA